MEIRKLNLDKNKGTANITNNYYVNDVAKDLIIENLTEQLKSKVELIGMITEIYNCMVCEKENKNQLDLFNN